MLILPLPVDIPVEEPRQKQVYFTRAYVRDRLFGNGWSVDEWTCLDELITRESEWLHDAANPNSSAYGLFQMLKTPEGLSIKKQTNRGFRYIESRYGTPCKALEFHDEHNYY
jgi:hypothetical protein